MRASTRGRGTSRESSQMSMEVRLNLNEVGKGPLIVISPILSSRRPAIERGQGQTSPAPEELKEDSLVNDDASRIPAGIAPS